MKNLKLLIGLLAGTSLYTYLMWYQDLGINALIFALLVIAAVFGYKSDLRTNRQVKAMAAGFLLSAIAVAINGNFFSEAIYYLSLLAFLSLVQLPRLKVIALAGLTFPTNYVIALKRQYELLKNVISELFLSGRNGERKKNKLIKIIRILTIITLFTVFLLIFSSAIPQFGRLCYQIFNPIVDFVKRLFINFDLGEFIHFLFVYYFLALFFFRFKGNIVSEWEETLSEDFIRTRKPTNAPHLKLNLKDEYKTALWSIVALNLLLLVVNLTDIFSVWLGLVPDSAHELSEFVHKGTYSLIFSVVLSMLLLLLAFRDNLNLYPDKHRLKKLANVWMLQNGILMLSVGLRNMHYVMQCGLTYKRIGVFLFLIAILILLFCMYLKIKQNKTVIYYLKTTNMGIAAMLILASLVNWDLVIASYNQYQNKNDVQYIKSNLSVQAWVYIPANERADKWNTCKNYVTKTENAGWQSFSWFDYWAAQQLK